jgi:alanine-glyoxylate transaminase / serine-glyoxylate transaminase / serine-pyruvate transaminase
VTVPPRFEPPERTLLGPGPSNVHPRVLDAMSRPVIGHLDPATLRMLDEIEAMLREVFRTSNDLTFPVSGSGTAGMESALMNVLEPGDTAIVVVSGFFAERMREIASRTGASVVTVGGEWGVPVGVAEVARALDEHFDAKAVCVVHVETSTGLLQPLEEIGALCRDRRRLFLVDAVASLGGVPVLTDEWGIDVCYSGSQKCLSVPPGLAPITFSSAAVRAREERVHPPQSFYLDALFIWKYVGSGERRYHHTAPINMLYGLHEGLRVVLEEGLEARWRRHQELGSELLAAMQDRGFDPLPPEGFRAPDVLCVRLPDGFEDASNRRRLVESAGIDIAGGLGELAGKVWRIGLMGESCSAEHVKAFLAAVDELIAG